MIDLQCGISVIIPAYNVGDYLRRCLDSVAAQSYTDFEVIVVNDCSPDGVADIAQEYCGRDSRFRLINQPRNMGTMEARRAGYESARGRYLTFLDGDDFLPEDSLEVMFNHITKEDLDIVFGGYENVYADGRTEYSPHAQIPHETKSDIFRGFISGTLFWVLWGALYKRELFTGDTYSFEGLCIAEDSLLVMQLSHRAERWGFIDKSVYCYYQRPESVMNNGWKLSHYAQYFRSAALWCDFYKQNYPEHYPLACRSYNRKIVKMMQTGYSMRQIRSTGYINSEIFSARGLVKYNSLRYLLKMWGLTIVRAVFPKDIQ